MYDSILFSSLIELSRRYGKDPHWVIGGGGNVSIKEGDYIWVKASGFRLETLDPEGFVQMNLPFLRSLATKEYPSSVGERERMAKEDLFAARSPQFQEKRPSVETVMHALFPHRIVFHTHPTLVNGIACSVEGKKAVATIFGEEVLWIPVINPGITLAQYLYGQIATYKNTHRGLYPFAVIIQNHGLLAYGDTLEEIVRSHDEMQNRILSSLSQDLQNQYHSWQTLKGAGGETRQDQVSSLLFTRWEKVYRVHPVVLVDDSSLVRPFFTSVSRFETINGAFSPDHIVYAGHRPLWVGADSSNTLKELERSLDTYLEQEGTLPKAIFIRNRGVYSIGENHTKAILCLAFIKDMTKISVLAQQWGGTQFMPSEEVNFIRNWEVEQFRKGIL